MLSAEKPISLRYPRKHTNTIKSPEKGLPLAVTIWTSSGTGQAHHLTSVLHVLFPCSFTVIRTSAYELFLVLKPLHTGAKKSPKVPAKENGQLHIPQCIL